LPTSNYGTRTSLLEANEDLKQDILLHLQGIGKYIRAADICDYTSREDVKRTYNLEKGVSLATAKRWMKLLGYRWQKAPSGQYVVKYRQKVFIPAWMELQTQMRTWDKKTLTVEESNAIDGVPATCWHHDESTFFENDRRDRGWVHTSDKPDLKRKGEGASLMVADFVSADYRWLRSPDGLESARVLFKAGKNQDGYFSGENIIQHVETAMDILEKHFPNEQHIFIFDNAKTHTKRADDALSARKMPKNTPAPGKNWGVSVTERDASGKIIYGTDGKPQKVIRRMADATLPNGQSQSLYFPEGHPRAGVFKGMAKILEERGLEQESKLRAECPGFKCTPGETSCCARQVLYNQPDFISVRSQLENTCEKRGFRVIFAPKFHCELNFIEMCWGYAKRLYRQYPPSKDECEMTRNVITALDSVPLVAMRRLVSYQ
jgi:hypothetical protein